MELGVWDPMPQLPFAHPLGWGEPRDTAVALLPSCGHRQKRCPHLGASLWPRRRALLAGDSSNLFGSWRRWAHGTQGCPSPPWAAKGALTPCSGGHVCTGVGEGVCIGLDKSCPSFAAWLQPQASRLVQKRPSSHRGRDAEPPETQGRAGLGSRAARASSPCEGRSPPTQGMCQPR